MKSSKLLQLGFQPQFVSEEESGGTPYVYYTRDYTPSLSFITDAFEYEGNINDKNDTLKETMRKESEYEYKIGVFDDNIFLEDKDAIELITLLNKIYANG